MPPTNEKPQIQLTGPKGTGGRLAGASAVGRPHAGWRTMWALPPDSLEILALIALLAAYGALLILVRDLFVMLTCWKWTNLLVLCCLASVIGEQGRRVLFGAQALPNRKAALIRGFFILLVIMAGHFCVFGSLGPKPDPQVEESQKLWDFMSLAASASLLSFTVALEPRLFKKILDRVAENFGGAQNGPPQVSPTDRTEQTWARCGENRRQDTGPP